MGIPVIAISEASKQPPAATTKVAAPKLPGQGRDAQEIFFTGINNLAKDPTGWIFGKPSPLYGDRPAAVSSFTSDAKGVVVPTASAESPQEKAARERAEDEARGKRN